MFLYTNVVGCEVRRGGRLVRVDDEIFADDGDGGSGGTDVLLSAEEDDRVGSDVDRAGKDVARAVGDEGYLLAVVLWQVVDGEAWVGKFDTVRPSRYRSSRAWQACSPTGSTSTR